jgi:hypothetical protein
MAFNYMSTPTARRYAGIANMKYRDLESSIGALLSRQAGPADLSIGSQLKALAGVHCQPLAAHHSCSQALAVFSPF